MTKILVIEDDFTIKENVIDILQEESFQAIDASNGLVGIKLAQEHQPDLILCDVRMPHMDGYKVLETLKQDSTTSSIPFIFITSKTSRQSWRRGMELGADDYLTKPFTPEELLKAIAIRRSPKSITCKSLTTYSLPIAEGKKVFEFDYRTNLPSRFALQDKFEQLVQHHLLANLTNLAKKQKIEIKIPFLWIEIANFANWSQLLASRQTALLLKVTAERLQISTFAQGIVSYLDNGVFAVILPSVKKKQEVISLISRIRKYLALPFESSLNLNTVALDIRVGVSFYPDYGTNAYTLLEQAKCAAKFSNNNSDSNYAFYKTNLQLKTNYWGGFSARRDILKAINQQDFQLTYQPQVCLKTGAFIGCEAVLNWQHSLYQKLRFCQLMQIAERAKVAQSLNIWFWEQACQQLNDWQKQGLPRLKLAVKVAQAYFYQDHFNLDIAKLLQKYQIPYGFLELEIAEPIVLQDKAKALAIMRGLSNLGITITLDEFGSGYSSMEYWQQFSVAQISLNCRTLQQAYQPNRYSQIIESAIALAHNYQQSAIAKAVQTQSDLQLIAVQKCDYAQGAYWSEPVTAQEFAQLFINRLTHRQNKA